MLFISCFILKVFPSTPGTSSQSFQSAACSHSECIFSQFVTHHHISPFDCVHHISPARPLFLTVFEI